MLILLPLTFAPCMSFDLLLLDISRTWPGHDLLLRSLVWPELPDSDVDSVKTRDSALPRAQCSASGA